MLQLEEFLGSLNSVQKKEFERAVRSRARYNKPTYYVLAAVVLLGVLDSLRGHFAGGLDEQAREVFAYVGPVCILGAMWFFAGRAARLESIVYKVHQHISTPSTAAEVDPADGESESSGE